MYISLLVMCLVIDLYHTCPTLRGCLASGLHHSTDKLVIIMFICVLVCVNVILYRYLLGPLALLDLMVSLMPTSPKGGALVSFVASHLHLIGGPSAQGFIADSVWVYLHCGRNFVTGDAEQFTLSFTASSNHSECDIL